MQSKRDIFCSLLVLTYIYVFHIYCCGGLGISLPHPPQLFFVSLWNLHVSCWLEHWSLGKNPSVGGNIQHFSWSGVGQWAGIARKVIELLGGVFALLPHPCFFSGLYQLLLLGICHPLALYQKVLTCLNIFWPELCKETLEPCYMLPCELHKC